MGAIILILIVIIAPKFTKFLKELFKKNKDNDDICETIKDENTVSEKPANAKRCKDYQKR